ncbi:hypothetical protein [Thermomonospora umbrina]|uniref:hypothetical protein n=1 Tax=Thermomonospora umbrina TaxID=111806 RepID=UPI000E231139|nr:hypothetical protein [Thermomonospora umbrina]
MGNRGWRRGSRERVTGLGCGDHEDLLRRTRRIHRELERYDGITGRQLQEEWETVEAAVHVALDSTDDASG